MLPAAGVAHPRGWRSSPSRPAVAALWLALASTASALTGPAVPRFTHLSVDDGLSQSSVEHILQDKRGYLWFGTKRSEVRILPPRPSPNQQFRFSFREPLRALFPGPGGSGGERNRVAPLWGPVLGFP